MLRLFVSHLLRLGSDQRGAVLIKFTIALLPLLTVVGVALDVSRIMLVKQTLTNAVDAAGIAVGRHPELDAEDATALAKSFVEANFAAKAVGELQAVTLAATDKQVDVTATARVQMALLQVLGYNSIDITVSSMVLRQLHKIELVMVLDNSGSMAGSRMTALQSSAKTLTNALFGAETTSKFVKIGLVPFTAAVNVGAYNIAAGWVDSTGLSSLHKEDIDVPLGKTLLDLFSGMSTSWRGCVRARTSGYDLTDEPPDSAAPATLFVPYFAPDGPSSDYANNYLVDSSTPGTLPEKQRNWTKYIGATPWTGGNPPIGPNYNCPAAQILPLTNVKATITSAIDSMVASGSTVIPEGIGWGWRVLSPTPPFTEGALYSDPDTLRFLIILTDGENNVGGGTNLHNKSLFSAFGFAASGHLGSTDGLQTRQILDAKTAALCANVKAKGIFVFTITLQVSDTATKKMLENCATPPNDCPGNQCYYHSPTLADLETAFTNIALGINKLRVAK
jgi:Flp pilus assembly protein TadG